MYADPRHIKDNRINARFDDIEAQDIELMAQFTGVQKSTLVRKATLRLIQELKQEFKESLERMEDAS